MEIKETLGKACAIVALTRGTLNVMAFTFCGKYAILVNNQTYQGETLYRAIRSAIRG